MPLNSLKQQELHKNILETLYRLAPHPENRQILPSHHEWPTTRQLADELDISIYKMRNLLLEMTAQGQVIVQKSNNKTLRWFPAQ